MASLPPVQAPPPAGAAASAPPAPHGVQPLPFTPRPPALDVDTVERFRDRPVSWGLVLGLLGLLIAVASGISALLYSEIKDTANDLHAVDKAMAGIGKEVALQKDRLDKFEKAIETVEGNVTKVVTRLEVDRAYSAGAKAATDKVSFVGTTEGAQ